MRNVRTAMQAHREQSRERGTGLMPSRVVNERHVQAMDAGNTTGRMIGRIDAIIMAMLGTMLTRFLPFLLFPESKEPPRFITYLGTVLPYAMTGLLVVYSLKGVRLTSGSHGIPELLAIIAIALLHIWKRNMLLSIAGGTAVYMLLVQLVFS